MTFAAVLLTVCLAAAPDQCEPIRVPVAVTMQQCAQYGQIVALDWLREHPGYELRGWRCEAGEAA